MDAEDVAPVAALAAVAAPAAARCVVVVTVAAAAAALRHSSGSTSRGPLRQARRVASDADRRARERTKQTRVPTRCALHNPSAFARGIQGQARVVRPATHTHTTPRCFCARATRFFSLAARVVVCDLALRICTGAYPRPRHVHRARWVAQIDRGHASLHPTADGLI